MTIAAKLRKSIEHDQNLYNAKSEKTVLGDKGEISDQYFYCF